MAETTPVPLDQEHKFHEGNEHAISALEEALRIPESRKRSVLILEDGGILDPIKLKAAGALQYLSTQLAAVDERLRSRKALDHVRGRLAKINSMLEANGVMDEALRDLNAAVKQMIWLKDLKEKIERNEATHGEQQTYVTHKERLWNKLRGASARAETTNRTTAAMQASPTGEPSVTTTKLGDE